jgi:alanine dehydrogenase
MRTTYAKRRTYLIERLKGMGFDDITILTTSPNYAVANQISGVIYNQFRSKNLMAEINNKPMAEKLSQYDIILNAILQDTDNPVTFVKNSQINLLKSGTLIIDVSCDKQIGFEFAKPTTFDKPLFQVGKGINYYSVDHAPSYLWDSASYEISAALIPFLKTVLKAPYI